MLTSLLLLAAALNARGRVGSFAVVLGQSPAVVEIGPDERYPMQSVYKFPIAMAVLHRVDRGELKLDEPITVRKSELVPAALHSPVRNAHPGGEFNMSLRELLRYAVSESDGTASDVLLRVLGGPPAAQAWLTSLGITDIRIVTTEMEMARDNRAQYRNWATPRAVIALLQSFCDGNALSKGSRQLLMEFMIDTATGPNRIRGLLPAGTAVAHKTGTSNTVKGITAATNDIGLVTLPNGGILAIAVFVSDSTDDTQTREAAIAQISRQAWDVAVSR